MKEYVVLISLSVLWLIAGYIFGKLSRKKDQFDGTIIIEPTEDGERDRIRFVLDMELDEIKTKQMMIFRVENQLSQK